MQLQHHDKIICNIVKRKNKQTRHRFAILSTENLRQLDQRTHKTAVKMKESSSIAINLLNQIQNA